MYSSLIDNQTNNLLEYSPKIINIDDNKLIYNNEVFNENNNYKVDELFTKDDEYNVNLLLNNTNINYNNEVFNDNIQYKKEKLIKKNLGDIEIIEWLKKQTDPNLAVFAEMLNVPNLNENIELMRANVHKKQNINLEIYIKKKRLGTKYANILYELKNKYGDDILKFLYLTII